MTRRNLLTAAVLAPATALATQETHLHADVRAAANRAEAEGQYDAAMILGGLAYYLADPSRGSFDMVNFETPNHLNVFATVRVQIGR